MKAKLLTLVLGAMLCTGAQAGLMDAAKSATEVLVVDQVMPEAEKTLDDEAPAPECGATGGMPGGWSEFELTPEIEEALLGVLQQLDTTGTVASILSVKSQVVSGVNYLVDFKTDSGEVWNAGIFQDLAGNYSLSEPASKGPSCP